MIHKSRLYRRERRDVTIAHHKVIVTSVLHFGGHPINESGRYATQSYGTRWISDTGRVHPGNRKRKGKRPPGVAELRQIQSWQAELKEVVS